MNENHGTREDTPSQTFDYIIVGGGSAGCVMANRLSADPAIRVLLIEAGTDFNPGEEPDALRDAGFRSVFKRNFCAIWKAESLVPGQGAAVGPMMLQPRVMGGGSTVNAMHAQRGLPRDYEEWRVLGVEGWEWEDVLPYFIRVEKDVDFKGPLHGDSGPIRIERVKEEHWGGISLAVRAALERRGLPRVEDMNAIVGDGIGPVPLNSSPITRVSTASAYLTQEVRSRHNLKVMANTTVSKLLIEGNRVIGVELDAQNGGRQLRASNTIVCAGAIFSPALLLRSGIGPAEHLRDRGIPVVADRYGVGKNLRNHPSFSFSVHLRRRARASSHVRPPCPMIVRYSSHHPGCPSTDMLLNLWERVPGPLVWDPLGRQIASFMTIVNKPVSPGGQVLLNASTPSGFLPQIRLNCFGDQRDLDRMIAGFRFMCSLLTEKPVSDLVTDIFMPKPNPLTAMLLQENFRAQAISAAGSLAMGGPGWLRHRMLNKTSNPILNVLDDPKATAQLILDQTSPTTHPSGTCRMGSPDQKEAVTDSRCRVIGVEGLRVVDASIFPTLMTAGLNLPVIMAAEKASEMVIEDRRKTNPAAVGKAV